MRAQSNRRFSRSAGAGVVAVISLEYGCPRAVLPTGASTLVADHGKAPQPGPNGGSLWWVAVVVLLPPVDQAKCRSLGSQMRRNWQAPTREAHRERGSLGAGRGAASLEVNNSTSDTTTPWTLCRFSSCGYQQLGAWGPCGCWLRRRLPLAPGACHPDQQSRGIEPGLLDVNPRPTRRLVSLNAF